MLNPTIYETHKRTQWYQKVALTYIKNTKFLHKMKRYVAIWGGVIRFSALFMHHGLRFSFCQLTDLITEGVSMEIESCRPSWLALGLVDSQPDVREKIRSFGLEGRCQIGSGSEGCTTLSCDFCTKFKNGISKL